MKITTNIDKVIQQLKDYRDDIDNKVHTFLDKLSAMGISVADAKFRTAQYDGTNDVVMDAPYWKDNTHLVVSASGNSVAFIEFGTGVYYSEEHPLAAEVGAIRGTFGYGRGSQQAWGYYGDPGTNGVVRETKHGTVVITHGNPPARALYDATKEMRQQMVQIAREVWGN